MTSRWRWMFVLLVAVLLPSAALAHIKWFVEVDPADRPLRLDLVLNGNFLGLLSLASLALFIAFLIDVHWSRRRRFDWIGRKFSGNPDIATSMVRIAVGVLCVVLWVMGHVLLTPELVSDWAWLPHVQMITALCMLFEPLLIVGGVGLLVLYGRGVVEYGLHHMLDYPIFLGLAGYLMLSSFRSPALKAYRLPWLVYMTMLSFLWVTVEKLGYPEWFDPFLDSHPMLTMGLPRDIFLLCAAFVEFTVAWMIMTGRNMGVVAALGLNALLIAGALYLGKTDTIAHFPINVVLAIVAVAGALERPLIRDREGRAPLVQAGLLTLGYWGFWVLIFLLYYGIHAIQYPCRV